MRELLEISEFSSQIELVFSSILLHGGENGTKPVFLTLKILNTYKKIFFTFTENFSNVLMILVLLYICNKVIWQTLNKFKVSHTFKSDRDYFLSSTVFYNFITPHTRLRFVCLTNLYIYKTQIQHKIGTNS